MLYQARSRDEEHYFQWVNVIMKATFWECILISVKSIHCKFIIFILINNILVPEISKSIPVP